MDAAFRQCSICKKPIAFEQSYYECSVSTCNRKKTGLFFCSVECWDAHLPMMRHRDAWAVATRAPTRADWEKQQAERDADDERQDKPMSRDADDARPARRVVGAPAAAQPDDDADVLIVVSKLKKYIRARSNMNTSDSVTAVLSEYLRALCNEAIRNAARDGRKTVFDRDFAPLLVKPGRRE
jgi:hypothetical protein